MEEILKRRFMLRLLDDPCFIFVVYSSIAVS